MTVETLITGILFFIIMGSLYLLPTIIAAKRRHNNLAAVASINLLTGWTGIGWVAAFTWAVSNKT
jgi:hypothetical protein